MTHTANRHITIPSSTLIEQLPIPLSTALWRNLIAGGRAAFFQHMTVAAFTAHPGHFIGLIALDLLVMLCLQIAYTGSDGHFNLIDLPAAVFFVPLTLLYGYLLSRWQSSSEIILTIPIAVISIDIFISLLLLMLYQGTAVKLLPTSTHFWNTIYLGTFIWWLVAVLGVSIRLTRASWRGALVQIIAAGILLALPHIYFPGPELWTANLPEETEKNKQDWYAAVREDLLYSYTQRLDDSLMQIQSGRKGVNDLYFVGVGGDASEDVFRHEIDVISGLFENRFGTRGRSLSLINSAATLHDKPIATATAITRSLKHIGKVMNRDEDVLFLYLTMHGSRDHRLGINFWPLELELIDPAMLKRMLDESGIKWRVLVISACYAGGFIELLKNDHTLIMTAADATHTSFGCGSESDFTYFGKALFDEQLRQTHSFTTAFEKAKDAIRQREMLAGLVPSNPQMYVGGAVRRKLEELERQWVEQGRREQVGGKVDPLVPPLE